MALSQNVSILASTSMAADITSNPVNVQGADSYAIQAIFTSTPVGTLKLQASCDNGTIDYSGVATVTNWSDIGGSQMAVIGAADNHVWTAQSPGYKWVRLVYTRTSGSGNLSANIVIHGDGN